MPLKNIVDLFLKLTLSEGVYLIFKFHKFFKCQIYFRFGIFYLHFNYIFVKLLCKALKKYPLMYFEKIF